MARMGELGSRLATVTALLHWIDSECSFESGGRSQRDSVQTLQSSDELFGEGLTGLGPEQTTGDARVLFDR